MPPAAVAAASVHEAEFDRIRRAATDARHQATAEHAGQLAELHRQPGAADHEIEVLRARLTTSSPVADHG